MPDSIGSTSNAPQLSFRRPAASSSESARSLINISNTGGMDHVARVTALMRSSPSLSAPSLLGMVANTFASARPETMKCSPTPRVIEGDRCLRPGNLNDGSCADAHASGLQHALVVGAGKNPSEEHLQNIGKRSAMLADQRGGADLTAAGFVLQAVELRRGAGNDIDTGSMEVALEKVVSLLVSPDLSTTSLGTYDGTAASKKFCKALETLRRATEVVVMTMGGVDSVLQDTAQTQVHDRLLQNLQQEFPEFFDADGTWNGPSDEQGRMLPPDHFVNRYEARQIQERSSVFDSFRIFDQFQGKVQELLKLSALIRERDDSPENPPSPNADMKPSMDRGKGPGPGSNWNQATGGSVGNITLTAQPVSGNGSSDAVVMKALEVLGESNKRISSLASQMLENISNQSADRKSKDDDSGLGSRPSSISSEDEHLLRRLDDLLAVNENTVDGNPPEDTRHKDGASLIKSPVSSVKSGLSLQGVNAESKNEPDSSDKSGAVSIQTRVNAPTAGSSVPAPFVKDGYRKSGNKWEKIHPDGQGYEESKDRSLITTHGRGTAVLDRDSRFGWRNRNASDGASASQSVSHPADMKNGASVQPLGSVTSLNLFSGVKPPAADHGSSKTKDDKEKNDGNVVSSTGRGTNPMDRRRFVNPHRHFNGA